jgi:enoyl-CoA hydratase
MAELVLVDRPSETTRVVTLNRPDSRNALSRALIAELGSTLRAVTSETGVRAVILTGADPAFCAGLDLKEVSEKGIRTDGDGGPNPWFTLLDSPVPVIAAVNGAAITEGFELALACDFIVASDRAVFADTHALIGVHPGGGLTATLADFVGVQKALELSLTGVVIDAAEAGRIGLANHVVGHDELLPFVLAIAERIAVPGERISRAIRDTYRAGQDAPSRAERLRIERDVFAALTVDREDIGARWQSIRAGNREQIG